MKTGFNTIINTTSIILFSLLLFAALPAAQALPAGAKCENGVVTARHYGPPGKGANWIPGLTRCETAEFAAMEVGAGNTESKATRSSVSRGAPGKPGYFWQYQSTNQ